MTETLRYAVVCSETVPSFDAPFPDHLREICRRQLTRWLDIKRADGWVWDGEPEFVEGTQSAGEYGDVTFHPGMLVRVQAYRPGTHD